MANNYSETSFMLPCTESQAKMAVWCLGLLDEPDNERVLEIIEGDRDSLEYMWERMVYDMALCVWDGDDPVESFKEGFFNVGFCVRPEPKGIWIYSEESFNSDGADQFIQAVLNAFNLDILVTYSVADTCSRPRLDEFGGYAVAVSKNHVEHIGTWSWMQEQKKKFKEGTFAA